jgi:hypothetical protein
VSESRETLLSERLSDERGKRVVFVSHCLLNENARYPGGAFHSGAVPEIAELRRRELGGPVEFGLDGDMTARWA